jgi:hypothetical protein
MMKHEVSIREQKSERRRSINISKNGAGQAVSMRGGQERNVADETVEIGFVGLGHMGTTMAVSLLAACVYRKPKSEHSGDEARRGSRVIRLSLSAGQNESLGHPCPVTGAS